MIRRHPLLAAGVLLCLGLGACVQADAPATDERPAEDASTASKAPVPRPGDAAAILQEVRSSDSEAILVNVWATWCIPCREEFPDLMRLHRELSDDGFELVLVSADFDVENEELVAFLTEQGVDFPTWIKTGDDMTFIDALDPDWQGSLPASFLYDEDGRLVRFWEGKATYQDLKDSIDPLLQGEA